MEWTVTLVGTDARGAMLACTIHTYGACQADDAHVRVLVANTADAQSLTGLKDHVIFLQSIWGPPPVSTATAPGAASLATTTAGISQDSVASCCLGREDGHGNRLVDRTSLVHLLLCHSVGIPRQSAVHVHVAEPSAN